MRNFNDKFVFNSSCKSWEYKTGHTCTILRKLTLEEADPEVGDMYEVLFDDGLTIHVFDDELS